MTGIWLGCRGTSKMISAHFRNGIQPNQWILYGILGKQKGCYWVKLQCESLCVHYMSGKLDA